LVAEELVVTRPRPKPNWIRNFSRSLTRGRLTVGNSRREPRSRRVKMEAIAAAPVLHQSASRPGVSGWMKRNLLVAGLLLLFGLIGYALFGTGWFYIYDIELAGNQYITK
jgi:hypothetical protein